MTNRRMKRPTLVLLVIGVLAFAVVAIAAAAETAPFRQQISSSGAQLSSGSLILRSTVGQPIAGTVQQGITMCSGYHCGVGVSAPPDEAPSDGDGGLQKVYLPMVMK